MSRADAFGALVESYGCGRVADALLAKWMADPNAEEQWGMLADAIIEARPGQRRRMPRVKRRSLAP
jgi:hypothetical protein